MHWRMHSVPFCNFFLPGLGEGVRRNAQKTHRGLRGPDGGLLFPSLYEKTVENHFYKGGVFFCALAHGHRQYGGLQFFPLGSVRGVPRSARKIYRGYAVHIVKL